MKKIICILLFTCLYFSSIQATGQMGERIIIGKDTLTLLAVPIENDSVLRAQVHERLSHSWSTACWRGYMGEWELKDNVLYLNKLLDYCCLDKDTTEVLVNLDGIFDPYKKNGRIKASWFTGDLRVARGDYIYYVHSGFVRTYEFETIYQIEEGVVTGKKEHHNSYRKPQISLEAACKQLMTSFNGDQFLEQENKRVVVGFSVMPKLDGSLDSLYYIRLAVQSFGEVQKTEEIKDLTHPYMLEFMRCLREIPDWEVLVKNGIICPTPIYTVFFRIRKREVSPDKQK